MCGRVVQARPVDVLADFFGAVATPTLVAAWKPAWNIPPTEPVVGLTAGVLDLYRWGLRGRHFNARAETVARNGLFSGALRQRRLAVIVDGFYEWATGADGRRRPQFFSRADGAPLALAGLWERGEATVVTTAAGPDVEGIHDRSPVVLEGDALARWLAEGVLSGEVLAALVAPGPGGVLVHHPVDPRVGDVRNNGPELVEPWAEPPAPAPPEPLRLFG